MAVGERARVRPPPSWSSQDRHARGDRERASERARSALQRRARGQGARVSRLFNGSRVRVYKVCRSGSTSNFRSFPWGEILVRHTECRWVAHVVEADGMKEAKILGRAQESRSYRRNQTMPPEKGRSLPSRIRRR